MGIDTLHFLKENSSGKSTYAIVKYSGKEEAIFFANHHSMDYGEGFIEEPCYLHEIYFGKNLDKFCQHYAENAIGSVDNERKQEYIKTKILPYIKKDVFYLIETPSVEPYLPEQLDEIKLISDLECIDWLLKNKK